MAAPARTPFPWVAQGPFEKHRHDSSSTRFPRGRKGLAAVRRCRLPAEDVPAARIGCHPGNEYNHNLAEVNTIGACLENSESESREPPSPPAPLPSTGEGSQSPSPPAPLPSTGEGSQSSSPPAPLPSTGEGRKWPSPPADLLQGVGSKRASRLCHGSASGRT